jgi:hypothetical protein
MNTPGLDQPPEAEHEPVLFEDELSPSEVAFNMQMTALRKPNQRTQRLVYDSDAQALIIFGLHLLDENITNKERENRFQDERDRLGVNPLHCLTWDALRKDNAAKLKEISEELPHTNHYETNNEGILCYGGLVLPAQDEFHAIITGTIRTMDQRNPTENQVTDEVLKKYNIPLNVLQMYYDLGEEALGTPVPAQNCGCCGRVVHPNGGGGGGPMVHGNPVVAASDAMALLRIAEGAGLELMRQIDALGQIMDTGTEDVQATITNGIEQSAVEAVPTTCSESAKELRRHALNAEKCLKDGVEYPPEQRMALQQISDQCGSVETLVQLVHNKLICVGDAGILMNSAGPFDVAIDDDAIDLQISIMLPSAGYSKTLFINISVTSPSSSETDWVTFCVFAKSSNDYICEDIISLLVQVALQDESVGKVSLESGKR